MAIDTKPQKLVNFDFEHDGHAIRFVEVPRWTYGEATRTNVVAGKSTSMVRSSAMRASPTGSANRRS